VTRHLLPSILTKVWVKKGGTEMRVRAIVSLWLVRVAIISGRFAVYAQSPCGGGFNNFGYFSSHVCLSAGCGGGGEVCEQDACECDGNGGYWEYCVLMQYCGRYPACNQC